MCFCSVGYNFFLISDFIQALIFLDESGERLINFVFSKNQLLVSFFPIFFFFFFSLCLISCSYFSLLLSLGVVVVQCFLVLLGVRFSSV